MHGYVTSVGLDWYEHARAFNGGELNVWRPGIQHRFRALDPGEPVLFRLKAPHDRIVGFAFFAHFSIIPVSFAWRIFGKANGVGGFVEFRSAVLQLRNHHRLEGGQTADPSLGAILVRDAVLLDEEQWIDSPEDLDEHAGHGKRYDLNAGEGRRIWRACATHLGKLSSSGSIGALPGTKYASGSFRVAVFDAWGRRCAVTGEGVAAALEAARFSPEIEGTYSLTNGILLRADLAHLLEAGYLAITPEHKVLVSKKIPAGEAGRDYERLQGTGIRLPSDPVFHPDRELLWWHQKTVFMG